LSAGKLHPIYFATGGETEERTWLRGRSLGLISSRVRFSSFSFSNAVHRSLSTFDDAITRRRPGSKHIHRSPIISHGPNEQWSGDGHDKGVNVPGLAVYGWRDVYSGKFLAARFMPSNRLMVNVHWFFLDLVCSLGGEFESSNQFPRVELKSCFFGLLSPPDISSFSYLTHSHRIPSHLCYRSRIRGQRSGCYSSRF